MNMDYKEKYDKLVESIKVLRETNPSDDVIRNWVNDNVPELKESEDEKIRKDITILVNDWWDRVATDNMSSREEMLAWLEKVKVFDEQLEQAYKTADEVQYKRGYDNGYVEGMAFTKLELEKQAAIKDGNSIDPQFAKPITTTETKYPKFKIGDWVVDEEDNHVYQVKRVVTNVSSGMSSYDLSDGGYFYSTKTNCHLWSIADAKDGDVLANDHHILILKELDYDWSSNGIPSSVKAYCGIKPNGNFEVGKDNWCFCGTLHIHPATKEQRDLLFQKMEEAGYVWNAVTKELSQISVKKSDKVWSEEDEKILCGVIDEIQANKSSAPEYDLKTYDKFLSWLKSLKGRVQPQPKQVWSEEDEIGFGDTLWAINKARTISENENDMGNLWYAENWLKNIKGRLQ